jgi:hypothetical protein
MEQWPRRKKGAEGLTSGETAREVVEGVGEVLRVMAICGSPSGMVGVGRSTGAGGGAHRRRGVRPNQGTIGQSNGSASFTKDQGRCVCKESENDSLDCSVYRRRRATEVRRGRSWISGEVLLGPSAWKASRATGEANRRQARLGSDWSGLAVVAEAWAVMAGGRELARAKEGRLASEGEHGVRRGAPGEALKARAGTTEGEGTLRT